MSENGRTIKCLGCFDDDSWTFFVLFMCINLSTVVVIFFSFLYCSIFFSWILIRQQSRSLSGTSLPLSYLMINYLLRSVINFILTYDLASPFGRPFPSSLFETVLLVSVCSLSKIKDSFIMLLKDSLYAYVNKFRNNVVFLSYFLFELNKI